jgi:hypothetical protein
MKKLTGVFSRELSNRSGKKTARFRVKPEPAPSRECGSGFSKIHNEPETQRTIGTGPSGCLNLPMIAQVPDNVGHIGRHLGKHGNSGHLFHPSTDITHLFGNLKFFLCCSGSDPTTKASQTFFSTNSLRKSEN